MPEVNEQQVNVAGNNWCADFDREIAGRMNFCYLGKPILETDGISFGKFSEQNAMISKLRNHQYMEYDACKVESVSVIPFGPEPEIRRSIEFVGNHAKIIVDIDMKKGFSANKLSVDNILLPGNWEKIAIVKDVPGKIASMSALPWEKLDADKEFTRNSDSPFLVIVLESDDGKIIEIGIGNDLWRWKSAKKAGQNAEFSIKKTDEGISFNRTVVCWPEETELATRLWRFTWYFSWMNKETCEESKPERSTDFPLPGEKISKADPPVFQIPASGWHPNACAVIDNQIVNIPCLQSPIVRKQLKRWVRSMANKYSDETVYLIGLVPAICESASHMERPKKQCLPHWNLLTLLDFWFWACRQFKKAGNDFHIVVDESCVWKELPSVIGLSLLQPKYSASEVHSEL